MNAMHAEFWTDNTSVLLKSFWGWRPETWATVGWSNDTGRSYRNNLLRRVTDPFIVVIYVTRDPDGLDRELVGKVAGFYLMSHETGHRNDFTHPIHHGRHPARWEHSLRALRAFSYISQPLLNARDVEPQLSAGSQQAIASWGKILEDPEQIRILREAPWREVPLYQPGIPTEAFDDFVPPPGMVAAGPSATRPYIVSPNAATIHRHLYIFRLDGDTGAYLGEPSHQRHIVKIGLSVCPSSRCRDFQKSMPQGAYRWLVERPSNGTITTGYSFDAAVAGENAMKQYLAATSRHLGGEFYLVTSAQIDEAWERGTDAARSSMQEQTSE